MRGKDLNLRPLGYEFDLCFAWLHAVPSTSTTYHILMALGSSCFGLLFLGSGSTFGSTSPPFSARQSAPFPVLILWAANPKGISWSRRDTRLAKPKESPRTQVSDCGLLPSRRPQSDQHRDLGPGTASREKPNNLAPFPTGGRLNFEGGGRHSRNFQRWEGKHSRNFRRRCSGEQYPLSYYNELFVWNQACQRQPAHFHLIGAETQIGRRTPSIVQSNR